MRGIILGSLERPLDNVLGYNLLPLRAAFPSVIRQAFQRDLPLQDATHPNNPGGNRGRGLSRPTAGLKPTFPGYEDPPTRVNQLVYNPAVPGDIAIKLFLPKCRIRLRGRGDSATLVAMPEASMHKDDCLVPRQDDVGLSG